MEESSKSETPIAPGYVTDSTNGKDSLGVTSDVDAFSALIASREMSPPLCIGLFGNWGSGKSFFMEKMRKRIEDIGKLAKKSEDEGKGETAYLSHIAHVEFNAWHYMDTNLWASLVSRIFEGLENFFQDTKPLKEEMQNLFKNLGVAKQIHDEAAEAKNRATTEVKAMQEQVSELQKQRGDLSTSLKTLAKSVFKDAIKSHNVKNQLDKAKKSLGLEEISDDIEEMRKGVSQLLSDAGTISALWKFFQRNRKTGLILLAVSLLGCGALSWFFAWIIRLVTTWDGSLNLMGLIGGGVSGTALFIQQASSKLGKATGVIKRAHDAAEAAIQENRDRPTPEVMGKQIELDMLRARESHCYAALEKAESEVRRAESEINKVNKAADGQFVRDFIGERARSSEYKDQLGIISTIRKDFEELSREMERQAEARKTVAENPRTGNEPETETETKPETKPRIDRIVLYIDDLDRCPESRVVDVLQAIHLLLAFPLFVVVVGVDPRWLRRSLRKVYYSPQDGMAGATHHPPAFDKDDWSMTPYEYIEKIFQIPFALKPMGKEGLGDLAVECLGRVGTQNQADATLDILLDPQALTITEPEKEFVAKLSGLVLTPRAAKRLMNIYRLIRASNPNLNDPFARESNFPYIMLLLGFQTASPRLAQRLFSLIRNIGNGNLSNLVTGLLRPEENEDSEPNRQDRPLGTADRRILESFEAILDKCAENPGGINLDATYFAKWVDAVERYSFQLE